jgi:hypothetical protein
MITPAAPMGMSTYPKPAGCGVGGQRLETTFQGEKFHDNRLIGKSRREQAPQSQSHHDYAFLSRRPIIKQPTAAPLIAGEYFNGMLEHCITIDERKAGLALR